MKKLLFALAILIMVSIPAALAADVEIPASSTSFATMSTIADTVKFNLSKETLPTSSFQLWSTDNKKWYSGAPTAAQISKFLDKGGSFYIANGKLDGTKIDKTDSAGYAIAVFANIQKRPKANLSKAKLFYPGNGTWTLSTATSVATHAAGLAETYEYGLTTDGKTTTWGAFTPQTLEASTSTAKNTYLFRAPAYTEAGTTAKYYPNSKAWKVKPAKQAKAPKLKVDYKKEVLKHKKNMTIATSTGIASGVAYSAAGSLDISDAITAKTKLYVRADATGKKPESDVQEITLATRAAAPTGTIGVEKGKLKDDNLKNYETLVGGAYKKLPKPTAATAYTKGTNGVRIKATAKVKSDGSIEGNAASPESTLTITWGVINTDEVADGKTAKNGVLTALFS